MGKSEIFFFFFFFWGGGGLLQHAILKLIDAFNYNVYE